MHARVKKDVQSLHLNQSSPDGDGNPLALAAPRRQDAAFITVARSQGQNIKSHVLLLAFANLILSCGYHIPGFLAFSVNYTFR
jgi:hypothetical protein